MSQYTISSKAAEGDMTMGKPRKPMPINAKMLIKLSESQLEKQYDRWLEIRSQFNSYAIALGYGMKRHSEILELNEPWTLEYQIASIGFQAVVDEQDHRKWYHGSKRPIKNDPRLQES